MNGVKICIVGGSGVVGFDGFTDIENIDVETPYGATSDQIIVGRLEGVKVAFLSRHGYGHRLSPTNIPSRANIYALKKIGIERIFSVSAVGSLKEEIKPLDLVVPDQLIDRTRNRISTFFEDSVVAHVSFSDPYCPLLTQKLGHAAKGHTVNVHMGGTYVVIEGPQFSTRAESNVYRSWGASVIGMTALPEAKLAREAGICYATLALVTDYDCWHETEEEVSVDVVLSNMKKNVKTSAEILKSVLHEIPNQLDCMCSKSLDNSVITNLDLVSKDVKTRLEVIMGKVT